MKQSRERRINPVLAMIEDPELRQLFKAESEEHLSRLDDGLLRLEKTPADQPLLEELFRDSHSLKGAARMLGLVRVEAAAHGLETVLNAARKGEAPLTPDTIERMNAALGDLRRHVQEALAGEPAAASLQASDALVAIFPLPSSPPHTIPHGLQPIVDRSPLGRNNEAAGSGLQRGARAESLPL
jgi:two-component system chemotaxis sensor kinase CheA